MGIYERKNEKGEPTGRYILEMTIRGKKHKESSRDLEWLRSRQAAIAAGVVRAEPPSRPTASTGAPGCYTVGNLLRDCQGLWMGHKDEITSTKRFIAVCDILGLETPLASVRTVQLDHVVATLRGRLTRRHTPMDAKTIRGYLSAFSAALKWALQRDLIVGRPIFPWPKKTPGNKVVISQTDEQRVLKLLKHWGASDVALVMDVLLATGARISEVTKLEPRHIDLDNQTVTFEDTKNGDSRMVFIEDDLAYRLLEAIQNDALPTKRRVRYNMDMARKELKIEHRVSPHVMRHTVGTRLDEQGISLATIGAQLGHKQVSTTMGYVHPQRAQLKKVSSLLARNPKRPNQDVTRG